MEKIINALARELNIKSKQAEATVQLLDEGNTVPFIARYRKEATGSLNDEQLRKLFERLTYLRNLEEKKEQVISSIEEQGKLTEELKAQILAATTLVAVEDLYRPYKQKRRTRATVAKEKGLEGLANIIYLQMTKQSIEEEAVAYLSEVVVTTSRLFKSETGMTFSDYVNHRKIEEATGLLQYSDYSDLEISNLLCFSSQSYFIKIFKKVMNMTPNEYKKKYRMLTHTKKKDIPE